METSLEGLGGAEGSCEFGVGETEVFEGADTRLRDGRRDRRDLRGVESAREGGGLWQGRGVIYFSCHYHG
jgi:hypothetical protein